MTQKMIRKRDGRLVEFHTEKIRNAIWRSFLGVGQTGMEDVSDALARKVGEAGNIAVFAHRHHLTAASRRSSMCRTLWSRC